MSSKLYSELTDEEAIEKIGRIISDCSSEKEAHERLKEELGLEGVAITSRIPTDQTGREVCDLLALLGEPTMTNGAMVMFMAYGPSGEIIP